MFDLHVAFFLFFFVLFEALTCSRREDGLSCRHRVKPPLTHPRMYFDWVSVFTTDIISTVIGGVSLVG